MTLVLRVSFLLLFMGGMLWLLLQKESADQGSEDMRQFEQELEKTQGSIEDQRKLIEQELKKQKDLPQE